MSIVKFALRYPYTFYVVAALMVVLGVSAIVVTPKDIFPVIDVPVVTVIWQYDGLTPDETEQRITTYSEYSLSSSVGDIKNIESQTLEGISVQRIYFQPNVNVSLAISQIVAATNSIRALMPIGIQPPIVVQYNASSVPVLQISLTSDKLTQQQLYDYGLYQVRQALAPIPGLTLPTPYGGQYRQIMVDLDPDAMRARGVAPLDVVTAINAQSLTLPSGNAKMGDKQLIVSLDSSAKSLASLNQVPIRQVGDVTVLLSDVAHVRDGWAVQQNVVHTDGHASVLLTVIKNGDASTLSVVNAVKAAMPAIQKAAPEGMTINLIFDQSIFVKNAIDTVIREGAIAASLAGLMILVFLGSWRSTLVVMVSIPLSILTSIAVLAALGQTLNTMTLGGLALAVGILVDDSTVTIENTHRLLDNEVEFERAVLEGSAAIALPTLISTLAICCVFVSVFFLEGSARYLFTPMAMAVVFAMLASYVLSRTLTPIVIDLVERSQYRSSGEPTKSSWFDRLHARFNRGFDRFRDFYGYLLAATLRRRFMTPLVAVALVCCAATLSLYVGSDFFPSVDAGLVQIHVRSPARTRIEKTTKDFAAIEDRIRKILPAEDVELVLDNIGLPSIGYNLAFGDGTTIGVNDGEILLQLKEGHRPTAEYVRALRQELPSAFPDILFYFQPADQVTQILNFGVASQIDVRVVGTDRPGNQKTAAELSRRLADIPELVDVHVQQELQAPQLFYTVDRTRAQELGLTVSQVANNVNISLSSSKQVTPNFWTDPSSGIPYYLTVQTPEYRIRNVADLNATPITSASGSGTPIPGLFGSVAGFKRVAAQSVINHSNIQAVYDVYGNVQDQDLGVVSKQTQKIVDELQPKMPGGNRIVISGQIESMNGAFSSLSLGLLFAAVFVYMLMVVNYQSFLDPLAVVLGLPGAGCGIVLMLYVTGTTFSVPSMMGAIMSVGVASANSILLVTFAREQLEKGMSTVEAAHAAGITRLRPVLMTAAAMMLGMLPMAIGGPGEEQNAVLARAVIGGMLVGTIATLLFVPYLYSVFGRPKPAAASTPAQASQQGQAA